MKMFRKIGFVALIVTALCMLMVDTTAAADKPSLAGRMLVAAPKLQDPFFQHAVVYLVEHDRDGAIGLIVNRKMGEGDLADLLAELDLEASPDEDRKLPLYFGGPVAARNVFVLHSSEYRSQGTLGEGAPFAMTANRDVIKSIADGTGPRRTRLMMGYSGWGAGQLESEIERGDWLDAPPDGDLIFEKTEGAEAIWKRARDKAGLTL